MGSSREGDAQAELSSVTAELQRVRRDIEELLELQTRLNARRTTLQLAQQVPHSSGTAGTEHSRGLGPAGDGTAENAITSTSQSASLGSWRKRLLARVKEVNITAAPDSSAWERLRRQQRRVPPPPEITTTTTRPEPRSSPVSASPSSQPLPRKKNLVSVWENRFSPPPALPEVTTTTNRSEALSYRFAPEPHSNTLADTTDQSHTHLKYHSSPRAIP